MSSSFTPSFFDLKTFEEFMNSHGVVIEHRRAFMCVCNEEASNSRTTCKNCNATGLLYAPPKRRKVILFNDERYNRYNEQSREVMASINVIAKRNIDLCVNDRISTSKIRGYQVEPVELKSDIDVWVGNFHYTPLTFSVLDYTCT